MKTLLANVVMMFSVLWAAAQPAPAAGGPSAAPKSVPRVIAVSTNAPLKLGGTVLVTLTNLSTLLDEARVKAKKVLLFVEGNELPDVEPSGIYVETNMLRFELKRTAANKAIWTPLVQNPITPEIRPLLISVGLHGEQPVLVEEGARGATLRLIGWNWATYLWLAIFLVLLGIFLLLAIYSDILRSPPDAQNKRGPYSMARTQAAYWLFLTTMSFAFIYVVTGDLTTLNGSVLTLLGISAGTYLASTMLDKPGTAGVAAAVPAPAVVAAPAVVSVPAPGPVQRVVTNFRNIPILGQFLEDILTEEKGVSVHRFQIFVWTIVLGIVFVISVGQDLVMPEFSATLLGLMGISSATFLAPKIKPNP